MMNARSMVSWPRWLRLVLVRLAARIPVQKSADADFGRQHGPVLRSAIRSSVTEDSCPDLDEENVLPRAFSSYRLSRRHMLVTHRCWTGAYNSGDGFWVEQEQAPYRPVLVSTSGTDYSDGVISASHKGRVWVTAGVMLLGLGAGWLLFKQPAVTPACVN